MNLDVDSVTRRFPTLVQLCQRVAATHINHISSLGDDLTYQLVKPILECCDAEQLLRLQELSPHLQDDTPEIWKKLCFLVYPLKIEGYSKGLLDEPSSWKDHYFLLREAEAKRLEEASTKLRTQRLEAEERKKEREVKITDRVPLPKRQRTGWSSTPQPKTLFQKTRTEASKLRKNLYHARIIPPTPSSGTNSRVLPRPPDASLNFTPSSSHTNRVTVNKVVHRRPATVSVSLSPVSSSPASVTVPSFPPSKMHSPVGPSKPSMGSPTKLSIRTDTSTPDTRPLKPQVPIKRDPMASLFVPKHRAHSQRP